MNPRDWSYFFQRQHSFSEADRLRGAGSSKNDLRSEAEQDLRLERLCRPNNTQPSISSGPDPKEQSPSIQNCKESEAECSDGERSDPELLRRKKELQEIEERILFKKAFIAVKTIGLLEKKSSDQPLGIGQGETLEDRVKTILRRHPESLFHKIQKPKGRLKTPLLNEGGSLQEPHPLKLRVQSLMKQRHHQPAALPASREKTPNVPVPHHAEKGLELFLGALSKGAGTNLKQMTSSAPLPSSSRGVASPAKGASRSDEAFERFLRLLNKNADVNPHETASDVPPPVPSLIHTSPAVEDIGERRDLRAVRNLNNAADSSVLYEKVPVPRQSSSSSINEESKVEKGFERFLSVLNKGVDINLLSKIVMDSKEVVPALLPSVERNKSEEPLRRSSSGSNSGAPLPGCIQTSSAESKTDRPERSLPETAHEERLCSVNANNRAASPLERRKKRKLEDEELPRSEEALKQLQDICRTLKLNMAAEKTSKEEDRTQGGKTGSRRVSGEYSGASSSPRSRSRSPRRHRKDQKLKHGGSHERNRMSLMQPEEEEEGAEGPVSSDRERQEASPYLHVSAAAAAAAAAAFPHYSLYQDPRFPSDLANASRDVAYPYCSFPLSYSTPLAPPPSVHSCQPAEFHGPAWTDPQRGLERATPLWGLDLSASEGQTGLSPCDANSRSRFLTVVDTQPSLNTKSKPRKRYRPWKKKKSPDRKRIHKKNKEDKPGAKPLSSSSKTTKGSTSQQPAAAPASVAPKAPSTVTSPAGSSQACRVAPTKPSDERKPQLLTEEEIKANLRKKLQAFNEKAKLAKQIYRPSQPDDSLSLELS